MDIFEHPGNLGSTRGTLLTVHHADWPSYPEGDDFRTALLQLTAFPPATQFLVVDDIDRSLLLIADVPCGAPDMPFDARNFHIAIWFDDLVEMRRNGYITGVECVTESEWRSKRWTKLKSGLPEGSEIGFKDQVTDEFVTLQEPPRNSGENNVEAEHIVSPDNCIRVTEKGRQFIFEELQNQSVEFSSAVSKKVAQLYELGFYDTCVREACVQLEHELKSELKSQQYGDRLTESFVKSLRARNKYLESDIRTFRQELRTLFKLVRNEYMHNLFEADTITAYAVLFRIARIRAKLASIQES